MNVIFKEYYAITSIFNFTVNKINQKLDRIEAKKFKSYLLGK